MRLPQPTLFFVVSLLGWTALGQPTVQLTSVPPKPTCVRLFNTGACADLWNVYNQARAQRETEELQIYVDRQKQLASDAAAAPLQQQITDLNKLVSDQQDQIGKLQAEIQSDAAASLDAQSTARQSGSRKGFEFGVGSTVLLLLLICLVTWSARRFTITKKL
jgi:hypothetical protein